MVVYIPGELDGKAMMHRQGQWIPAVKIIYVDAAGEVGVVHGREPTGCSLMGQGSNLEGCFNYTERSGTNCIGMCSVGSPVEGQKDSTLP